jgi:hypothetical protein
MDDTRSIGRLYARRQAVRGLIILALGAVAWWAGLFDLFSNDTIDREKVEKAAETALIYEGVSASDVSCPGDLERKKGAKIVCTYTDPLSVTAGAIARPEDPPPPKTGRFEIRVKGFKTRSYGNRSSSSTSTPEYDVRVIERAR